MIKIKLGSNAQEFLVAPDTASSNLWIYSKQCQAFECSTHNKYDSSKSESYEKDGRDFKLRTANGKVEGFVSKDMCKFTDDITAKMSFGEIVSVKSKTPVISKMDGTIGLGFDIASVDHLPTFMSQTSDIKEKTFAFYLKDSRFDSYMTIPGIDEELGLKEISTHQVVEPTQWNLWLSLMTGPNGTIDVEFYQATIDTAIPFIVGPNKLIEPLMKGVTVERDCSNLDSLPDFKFTIDQTDYVLAPNDYVIKTPVENGLLNCSSGIIGADWSDSFEYVIFGDIFIRKFPTKFDFDNKQVTFYEQSSTE